MEFLDLAWAMFFALAAVGAVVLMAAARVFFRGR